MSVMTIEEVRTILPHRYPFLLVDRILECDLKTRIVGLKNVTANEPFFQGHFPEVPVMPGVLQIEAIAQVGGVLLNKMLNKPGVVAYLLGVDKTRFRRQVKPGDQLTIEVTLSKTKLNMSWVHGVVRVDGQEACRSDIMFGYGD